MHFTLITFICARNIIIYIYIYTHTHTYIYIYIYISDCYKSLAIAEHKHTKPGGYRPPIIRYRPPQNPSHPLYTVMYERASVRTHTHACPHRYSATDGEDVRRTLVAVVAIVVVVKVVVVVVAVVVASSLSMYTCIPIGSAPIVRYRYVI